MWVVEGFWHTFRIWWPNLNISKIKKFGYFSLLKLLWQHDFVFFCSSPCCHIMAALSNTTTGTLSHPRFLVGENQIFNFLPNVLCVCSWAIFNSLNLVNNEYMWATKMTSLSFLIYGRSKYRDSWFGGSMFNTYGVFGEIRIYSWHRIIRRIAAPMPFCLQVPCELT
jgi:hypothetical protein